MAQAKVTDFFLQSKKAGIDRTSRSKASKNRVGAEACVGPEKQSSRTRQRSCRSAVTVQPAARETLLLGSEHEEFLRVIDEAVSAPDPEARELEKLSPSKGESPRTPKRSSAEAEFDLSAAAFSSTAELHSTAKKRLRVAATGGAPTAAAGTTNARKKLVLNKQQETQKVLVGASSLKGPYPVVDGAECFTVNKPLGPSGTAKNKKISREDVASLKARLQKLKSKAETVSSPTPAPESTLFELKAHLESARDLASKPHQRKEAQVIKDEKSNAKQNHTEPSADTGKNLPAYQRYHTLAQGVPPGLTLPYNYKVLTEMFRSMDTIVAMLFNRSETVTFSKVKQGVQDMMRKRFEESHVGQIKTVYPSAYTFRQEKNIPSYSSTAKKFSYQLTVEPLINEDTNGTKPVLSATCLLKRRHTFHQNLVEIVKGHHKVFLASLNPPVMVSDDKLTRWHPRFNADEVPSILSSDLPQPPQTEKLTTAQEVLDRARARMTPKMEKALANMALKTAEATCSKETEPKAQSVVQSTSSALKGVSQSLLDRIRAKEAQKLQAAMTRNPEQEERLGMMERLPEMARILRNVFVAEKKPVLNMELACNRMVASYRSSLSSGDMEKHLRLLVELVPDWLKLHPIRKDFYLKLNKNTNMSLILEKLNQKLKEEQ